MWGLWTAGHEESATPVPPKNRCDTFSPRHFLGGGALSPAEDLPGISYV